jgi:hypothetical protein
VSTPVSLQQCLALHQHQQWQQAAEAYTAFLKADPEHTVALVNLGAVYRQMNAIDDAGDATKKRRRLIQVLLRLGSILAICIFRFVTGSKRWLSSLTIPKYAINSRPSRASKKLEAMPRYIVEAFVACAWPHQRLVRTG